MFGEGREDKEFDAVGGEVELGAKCSGIADQVAPLCGIDAAVF